MSVPSGRLVQAEDVVEERNFIRQVENALGISEDFEGDDTMLAALVANSYRQARLLEALVGEEIGIDVIIEEVNPEVSFPSDATFEISEESIENAIEATLEGDLVVQIYNESVTGSGDNVLSRPLEPSTDHSKFTVTVTIDTATSFSLRTNPDDETPFTEDFNAENGNLVANSKYEFGPFEVDQDAEYNFRCGAAATVTSLRVMETVV